MHEILIYKTRSGYFSFDVTNWNKRRSILLDIQRVTKIEHLCQLVWFVSSNEKHRIFSAVPLYIGIIFADCDIYMRLSRPDYTCAYTRPHLSRVRASIDGRRGGGAVLGILDSRRGVSRRDATRRVSAGASERASERTHARARREPEVYFRGPHQFRRLYSPCDES